MKCPVEDCNYRNLTGKWDGFCRRHRGRSSQKAAQLATLHRETYVLSAPWPRVSKEQRRSYRTAKQNERHASQVGVTVEFVDRTVVLERDGEICYLCGWMVDPEDWHMDHVVPLSRGGEHSYANVRVTHPRCNLRKYNKVIS